MSLIGYYFVDSKDNSVENSSYRIDGIQGRSHVIKEISHIYKMAPVVEKAINNNLRVINTIPFERIYWDNYVTDEYLTLTEFYERENLSLLEDSFSQKPILSNKNTFFNYDSSSPLDKDGNNINPTSKADESILMNYLSEEDKNRFEEFRDVLEVCHWAVENHIIIY
ncbi:hypothetical protein FO519_005761 [Halicephalobus sp. NKZ332]|nr:hypothetical protein FO519_005761 [Halicephalobus sp. NKZ332]